MSRKSAARKAARPPVQPPPVQPPPAPIEEPPPADSPEPVPAPAPPDPAIELLVKIAGGAVATGLGAVAGLYEAFLAPLWFPGGHVRAPLALVLALAGNPLIAWFAYVTTGRRATAFLPAIAWSAVWFTAASRTTEGDLVIAANNWVGLVTLFLGPAAFAAGIYLSLRRERRPPA